MSILERETAMNKDYGWPGAGHGDQDARYPGHGGRRRQPTDPTSGRPQPGEGGLQYGGGIDRRGPTTPPTNTRRLLDKTSAEILRQRKQQRMASEDIELWQQRKLEKDIELAEEKKRDLEMLKGYKPWGKPSGGAPRLFESGSVDAKHRGLHWENHDSNSPEDGNFPFGRSGGGAPRKSDSGRIITTLRKDPNTRFQKHLRNEVDNTLRYSKENVPSSQGDLGQPPGARRRHPNPLCVEQDDEKHKRALKYSRKLEEQILEQRERKLKEMAERTKAQKVYDPFGRDIPERDSSGNIVRRAQKPRGNQDEDVGRGNHPSAFPFGSHNLVHKKVQNIKDKAFDDTDGYDPWGRPGGGAPIKDNAGNRLANRTGALEREKNSATTLLRKSQERRAYLDSLRNGTKQQNHSQLSHSESAGVEVASWIRSGVVGNPPMDPQTGEFRGANRTITDVVTNKLAIRRQAGEGSQQYYKDLQHQAQERHENRLREKEKDKEMTRKHLDTLSKMWESPGKKHQQAESRAPLGMDIKLKEERQRYHEELMQQRQLQDEARVRQNQREIEEEQRHIEAYNQQWGRPGCGAPNKTTLGQHKYKSVLDPSGNILRRRS